MSRPDVSVVIAAHNMEAFIGETLASLRSQTLSSFEAIVVDDGSTDRTAAVVAAIDDPRIRLLTTPNSGVSAARNCGLAACSGPMVLFLDADDLLTPEALERLSSALSKQPSAPASYAHHVKVDESGQAIGGTTPSSLKRLAGDDTLRHLITKNIIVNGGVVCLRTHVARAVGGYDETLRYGEDWEFWCRVAAQGDFVPLQDFVALRYRIRAAGANTRLAGSPFRPTSRAIELIYAQHAVRSRFDPKERARRRRLAEMNVHWSEARSALAARRTARFANYLAAGLVRYPETITQWRQAYLFLRGLPLGRLLGGPA